MSARGKPNLRKVVKPNIAAATRIKPEKTENESTNGDAKVPNRGRGRGARGAARPSTRPQIIQSEGTFTAGLSEGPLKANRQANYGTEEVVGKLDKSINSLVKPKVERSDKSDEIVEDESQGFHTYESEWLSDDGLDELELHEMTNSSFISDRKKGREVPIVLPQKDFDQFRCLVRGSQAETINGTTSEEVATNSSAAHPAGLLQKYLTERSSDLMLLQMPASLDVVHQAFSKNNSVEQMEVDEKPSSSNRGAPQKHCMDGLPTGAEIGKLQLLKNGKVRLVIGNRVMDMHEAIPSKMFETIVQTQTFVAPKNEPETSTSQSSSTNQGNTGSMTVLGNVGDSFLCTYNVAWDG